MKEPKFKIGDHVRVWRPYSSIKSIKDQIGKRSRIIDLVYRQGKNEYVYKLESDWWFKEDQLRHSAIELDIIWKF